MLAPIIMVMLPRTNPKLLDAKFLALLAAQNVDEFRAEMIQVAQQLGFRTTAMMVGIDHPGEKTEFILVHNVPDSTWLEIDPAMAEYDPVMQHCKKSSLPIIWGPNTYRSDSVSEIYDIVSAYGLKGGICTTTHNPDGTRYYYSVDSDQELTKNVAHLTYICSEFQAFAAHAQDTAARLLGPKRTTDSLIRLQVNEATAMLWTLNGLSIPDISDKMNINEVEAVHHIKQAVKKLHCVNEHQAALKALRFGLL